MYPVTMQENVNVAAATKAGNTAKTSAADKAGNTNIELVDKQAWYRHLELSAEAVEIRANADVLDRTKYKDSSTCAYEEAVRIQTMAHKFYMKAIGLHAIQPTKGKSRPRKRKQAKTKPTVTRTNPSRTSKSKSSRAAAVEAATTKVSCAFTLRLLHVLP